MRLGELLRASGAEMGAPGGEGIGLDDAIGRLPAPSPWINRLVAGFGAWLSSCFFCGSFALCFGQVLDLDDSFGIVVGLSMIVAGAAAHRVAGGMHGGQPGVAGLFVQQVALSWALAGQAMLYGFTADEVAPEVAAVAMMGMAPALMIAFADPIQRFVAAAAGLGGLVWLLRELDLPPAAPGALASVAVILLAWLPPERSLNAPLSAMRTPLIWAGYLALCCINLFQWNDGWLFDSPGMADRAGGVPWWVALPAALGLLAASLERQRALRSEIGATLLAAILGVAALTQGRAGVLLGLIGVMLGWDRRDRALTVAGVAYFLWFGAQYYYDLSLDLWTKGGALIGSGALLLALRGWLRYRGFITDAGAGAGAGEGA